MALFGINIIETEQGFKIRPNSSMLFTIILGFLFMGIFALTCLSVFQDRYRIWFLLSDISCLLLFVFTIVSAHFSWNAYIYFEADKVWQKKWKKIFLYGWHDFSDCIFEYKAFGWNASPVIKFVTKEKDLSFAIVVNKAILEKLIFICLNHEISHKLQQYKKEMITGTTDRGQWDDGNDHHGDVTPDNLTEKRDKKD